MAGHTHIEESSEMYLQAVYRLEREGSGVTTSGLALKLGVAPASVSGMLKKLAADGYISYQARGEAKLTRPGLEIAVRIIRRHRLAEVLLVRTLGLDWAEVHEEACRLEHAISARVEDALVAFLDAPKTCPHGHPIPPLDLSDPERPGKPLAQLAKGDRCTVHGVTEEISELLRYLADIGLRPGAKVMVVEKAPLEGPVTVRVGERQHAISLELARMLIVIPEVAAEAAAPAATSGARSAASVASAGSLPA